MYSTQKKKCNYNPVQDRSHTLKQPMEPKFQVACAGILTSPLLISFLICEMGIIHCRLILKFKYYTRKPQMLLPAHICLVNVTYYYFLFLNKNFENSERVQNCYKTINLLCIELGKKESVVMSGLHQVPLEKNYYET